MPYHNIQWVDMQYTAIISNTIQYNAMWYNTMKCHAIHCNAIEWNKIQRKTIQQNQITYHTIQKRPNISPKCVITMSPTKAEQPVTVVTKSGTPCPPRTSRATKRGTLGLNEPFLACFWPFPWAGWFQIDCNSDVWAGRSVAMIWTPHTPIFGLKKIWPEIGPQNLRSQGKIALLGPLRLKWRPNISL